MSSKRLYYLLIGLITVLFVGLLAGTYGANSLLSNQADKLTALKAKSMALTEEQLTLNEAKKDVQKYASLEQIAQTVVPEDKDQAEAVREITNIAAASGVSLASINFPASTLGTSTDVTSTSSTGAAATAPAISSANSPTDRLSQLVPVKDIPGVYELQITVAGDPNKPVAYNQFLDFLTALEYNRRTAQVSTITLAPSATNDSLLTFSLTLNEYIKP